MKAIRIACLVMSVLVAASIVFAEEVKRTAKVIEMNGEAEVKTGKTGAWSPLEIGAVLNEGDIVKTSSDSTLTLNVDGSGETATVDVEEDSQILLSELILDKEDGTERTLLDLAIGKIMIRARKLHTPESRFEVKTPTSIVGVRGTEFTVQVEAVE